MSPFSPQAVRERMAARLGQRPPREPDETVLSALAAHMRSPPSHRGEWRRSAVLVPLYERCGETMTLYVKRGGSLAHHPGQYGFPGGREDAADQGDPWRTALREAREEVGIDPARVRPLGVLDDVPTISGFVVRPCVAWIDTDPAGEPLSLSPQPGEIDAVVEVPFRILADPAVFDLGGAVLPAGFEIHEYRLRLPHNPGQLHLIWGATGRMTTQLLNLWREVGN